MTNLETQLAKALAAVVKDAAEKFDEHKDVRRLPSWYHDAANALAAYEDQRLTIDRVNY